MKFQNFRNDSKILLSSSRTRHGKGSFAAFCLVFLSAFAAQAQNHAIPRIVQPLIPTTVAPGSANLTLTVSGTGFISTSVVNWNGTPLVTTFVSSDKLTAIVPSADLAVANTGRITVSSPAPGGGVSNTIYFPVATKLTSVLGFTRTDFASGVNGNPVAVVVADFNNDGFADFAVANDFDNTVGVFIGNGDGTFKPAVTYTVDTFPLDLFAGDFNNDGKLDIVTVNTHDASISILLGNGDGTFQQPSLNARVGSNPESLNIGDFNGDGNLDVAAVNYASNTVSVLLGLGTGRFAQHVDYPVGNNPLDVTVGDFNGDGIPDLAVANNADSTISILLGNGDGTFQPQTGRVFPTGSTPNGITTADFNGDGILDLATTDGSHQFSVLIGKGDGTFPTVTNYKAGNFPAYTITAYDMNSAGTLDLLFGNFNDDTLAVYFGNGGGTGTFKAAPVTFPTLNQPVSLSVGDFNNDGRLDVVAAQESANMVSVFLQNNAQQPTLTPASLSFGNQQIGLNGGSMPMTLKNLGTSSLTITSISLTGLNASEFSQTNTCTTSLGAGQTCVITVTFLPLTEGIKNSYVSVVTSAGTQLGPVMGFAVQSLNITPRDVIVFPLTVVGQSSTPVTVTLSNVSGVVMTVSTIFINGHNPNDFMETNTCLPSIPPLGSCTLTTTFTPTTNGGREGTDIIMSSASTPKRSVQLSGTATSVSLSPTKLNFGRVTVGTSSAPMAVTLTNVGPNAITVQSISFTGVTDYTETDTCVGNVIPVNGTCSISVVFTPQVGGARVATMNVNDTDLESPQTVLLQGTGQ
jgi:hypothetical protein